MIKELRAKLEAATPGKWEVHESRDYDRGLWLEIASGSLSVAVIDRTESYSDEEMRRAEADAAAIVAFHDALPALLAVVEAAEKYVDSEDDAHYRDRLRAALASLTRNDEVG